MTPLVVAVALAAAAVGALGRYAFAVRFSGRSFPWAVLVANLAGSAIAGAAIAITDVLGDGELRYVLLSGVAGGLTTFSTFSVETVQLTMARRHRAVVVSVGANLFGGLAAVVAGWAATVLLLGGF